MDRLVDEAEGLVAEGSASVCSSSSGRMEPPTDQQINLLNSITASDLSGAPQHPHAQNKNSCQSLGIWYVHLEMKLLQRYMRSDLQLIV